MPSEADICSDALVLLGDQAILSLDDTSDRASACKQLYPRVRDSVLRAHPWKFATMRATLARTVSVPAFGYAYSYQLPTDFIRLIEFVGDWSDVPFTREAQLVLTDSTTCAIRYVARITDPNLFDTLFIAALSARMAAELALPIKGDGNAQRTMLSLYQAKIQEAVTIDSMEQTPDLLQSDVLTRVR